MKKLHFLGFLLLIVSASYTVNAQIQSMNELSVSPPTFQNSNYNGLTDFFQKLLIYPASSINKGIQGTEVIRYTISENGTIEDVNVINSLSEEIDKEVIRVLLETYGYWSPGSIDRQPTAMEKEIVLSFALISFDNMLKIAKSYMQKGNRLLYSKDNPERALVYYNKAYKFFPCESCVLLVRGCCLQKLGRTEEAVEVWERMDFLAEQNMKDTMTNDERIFSNFDKITFLAALNK